MEENYSTLVQVLLVNAAEIMEELAVRKVRLNPLTEIAIFN